MLGFNKSPVGFRTLTTYKGLGERGYLHHHSLGDLSGIAGTVTVRNGITGIVDASGNFYSYNGALRAAMGEAIVVDESMLTLQSSAAPVATTPTVATPPVTSTPPVTQPGRQYYRRHGYSSYGSAPITQTPKPPTTPTSVSTPTSVYVHPTGASITNPVSTMTPETTPYAKFPSTTGGNINGIPGVFLTKSSDTSQGIAINPVGNFYVINPITKAYMGIITPDGGVYPIYPYTTQQILALKTS